MARRGIGRPLRIALWSLAGLAGVTVVAIAVIAISFDPDSLKPRIVAAVKQATGRDLVLGGHLGLGLSLQPTVTAQSASLANPPGFSRPQMITLDRLELKLALIPLLSDRIEIRQLVLVKPDILLERNAQGQPNWEFVPEARVAAPTTSATPSDTHPQSRSQLAVAQIRVQDGRVTWQDDRSGRHLRSDISALDMQAASADDAMQVSAAASYDSTPFTVAGEFGSLNRLRDRSATTPWPVRLQVRAAGAQLSIDGGITQPLEGRGYTFKVAAAAPDLAALGPLLPGQHLPALRDIAASAQVADRGGPLPAIADLALQVGPSDLNASMAGLKLDKVQVAAGGLDQAARFTAQGSLRGAPMTLEGSVGPIAATTGPLDVTLRAFGSVLTVKGTAGQGADGRPNVQADVSADALDVDPFYRAAAALAPPPTPAPAAAGPAPPPAPAATPPTPRPANGRLFPDTPLPFPLLRDADADIRLKIGQLKVDGSMYRAIAAHLDLKAGKLRLDPVSVDMPEGHVDAALTADATVPAPPVTLRLRIPALALAPLFTALGQPAYIAGNVAVQADLNGAGVTPHALAASLGGTASFSMANGTVDNRVLGSALGSVLREVNLLDLVGRGGTSQVECFTARVEAARGVATIRPLVLVSSLLAMDGDGSINLGAETIDLHLRPQAKIAGTDLVVPLRVVGNLRAPKTESDPAGLVTQNAGTVAGAVLGGATPLGQIAGALGAKQLLGGSSADCGPALAAARGTAQQRQQPKQPLQVPNVGGVLKQLFR